MRNKRNKRRYVAGFVFIFILPILAHAQRPFVKETGIALRRAFEKSPVKVPSEFTNAVERNLKVSGIGRNIIGSRLITGAQAKNPLYSLTTGETSSTQISQLPLPPVISPSFFRPSSATAKELLAQARARLRQGYKGYQLSEVDIDALLAGSYNKMAAVIEAVESGGDPRLAFLGALENKHLSLANEIVDTYHIDVNAPILEDKTALELLPRMLEEEDKRLAWLLSHNFSLAPVISKGILRAIKGNGDVETYLDVVNKEFEPIEKGDPYNKMAALREVVEQGGNPKLAFLEALRGGYLSLANEIVARYNVDINSPILGEKTVLELLPDLTSGRDRRWNWLLEHHLNPNLVMKSDIWQGIDSVNDFEILVHEGLDPMVADENGYTALHWYMSKFIFTDGMFKFEDRYNEYRLGFLDKWLTKFPEANPNVKDSNGNTPLHYLKNTGVFKNKFDAESIATQIAKAKKFNLLAKNGQGELPYLGDTDLAVLQSNLKIVQERILKIIGACNNGGRELIGEQRAYFEEELAQLWSDPRGMITYLLSLGATPHDIMIGIFDDLLPHLQEYKWFIGKIAYEDELTRMHYILFNEYGVDSMDWPYRPYVR